MQTTNWMYFIFVGYKILLEKEKMLIISIFSCFSMFLHVIKLNYFFLGFN